MNSMEGDANKSIQKLSSVSDEIENGHSGSVHSNERLIDASFERTITEDEDNDFVLDLSNTVRKSECDANDIGKKVFDLICERIDFFQIFIFTFLNLEIFNFEDI